MQKKVLYWSPHINKEVATVKAVLNSAYSLSKYGKNFKPIIINTFGEWDNYSKKLNELNIGSIKIFNWKIKQSINGFWKSRLFYIFLSLIIFFPLIKIIKKEKPDYVLIHLITIPVLLASFFFKNTKFILRISGFPQLNIFRKSLWKILSKRLYSVFTPTLLTRELLIKNNIYTKEKIFLLRDPIVEIRKIVQLKKENIDDLSKTTKYVIMMRYKKNIFNYLNNSLFFVLTSDWEDPGFVLVEAAICNKLILSSNVKNGPIEFVDNENNGILYKKNDYEDFERKFIYALNTSQNILIKKRISAKIKAKKYTIFSHYLQLAEYLKD